MVNPNFKLLETNRDLLCTFRGPVSVSWLSRRISIKVNRNWNPIETNMDLSWLSSIHRVRVMIVGMGTFGHLQLEPVVKWIRSNEFSTVKTLINAFSAAAPLCVHSHKYQSAWGNQLSYLLLNTNPSNGYTHVLPSIPLWQFLCLCSKHISISFFSPI